MLDCGQEENAIQSFVRANEAVRRISGDSVFTWRKIGQLVTKSWCESQLRTLDVDSSSQDLDMSATLQPIFVVGMPRSGSSLLEQCLANHSLVQGLGEIPTLSGRITKVLLEGGSLQDVSFRDLKSVYMQELNFLLRKQSIFVDKQLFNMFYVGLLSRLFPKARFIGIERSSEAITWSTYRMFFSDSGMSYACSIKEIKHLLMLKRILFSHWSRLLPDRFMRVEYEALTKNPEARLRELFKFLELSWEDGVTRPEESRRPVLTASSLQVTNPISPSSPLSSVVINFVT